VNVISHRGYWKEPAEQNADPAFERSLRLGFGIETDIRDSQRELVISHDLPVHAVTALESFFELYSRFESELPLALNIKSDGMQNRLKSLLEEYDINNYFLFDMAIPDALVYCWQGFNVFTRQSEYEISPPYYNLAQGVWLDEFHGHWITDATILEHLDNGKQVVDFPSLATR